MKSMTGYGEATQNIKSGKVTVQIRSVNHRHLDLQVRAPREFLSFEEDIRKLVRKWQAKAVLITRGPDGMSLFRPRGAVHHFPTEPRDVFEVTGAGDTVVATCALALASGASYEEAAILANLAAGFVGDEVGTVAVPIEKLTKTISENL